VGPEDGHVAKVQGKMWISEQNLVDPGGWLLSRSAQIMQMCVALAGTKACATLLASFVCVSTKFRPLKGAVEFRF
jgi:hypothetical protein